MKDGEMKEIPIEVEDKNYKVLLSRLPGPVFYCTSHLCTHYRARLVTGVLNCRDSTITCPWHVAAWDLRTGDIEEAPALKGLQRHSLQIEDESVFLLPEIEKLEMTMVDPATTTTVKESLGTFVIVGGGAAGAVASVQLRASGFKGRIIVVTEEPHHPIDRIKLSKSLSADPSSLSLHPASYLEKDLGIEYFLDSKCTSVDPLKKTITTTTINNETLNYDKLLIATGAQPIELAIPGAKHPNCHVLRSIKDSSSILSSLIMLGKIGGGDEMINVCIIGSSFIGLECAAMLAKLKVLKDCPTFAGCNVTVVGMDKVPFERTLGEDVGRWMMEMHQKVGNVTFEMEQVIKEVLLSKNSSDNPLIEGVLLSNGKRIACQMVIMGVGVRCSSGEDLFPQGTFEDLCPADRSIPVDSYQRVIGRNVEKGTVFAAGDVASTSLADGGWQRIEHWDVAQQQGRIAAKNMAVGCFLNVDGSSISCGGFGSNDGIGSIGIGSDDGHKDKSHNNDDCDSAKSDIISEQEHEYNSVPFFFTMQYGKSVRFAGYIPPSTGWKRTIFTTDDKSFICYYVDGDERIIAVATLGCDPLAAHCLNLMKNGTMLSPKEIEEQKLNPLDVLLL